MDPVRLSHPKYRPDIDGLRAVAVISVVAFHAFPNWIKGGFIGVDVFFVISGFLISTIIFDNLEQGRFSFSEFYSRRIKRICPALIAILLTCCVFGWFVLLDSEYKQLGIHTAGGAGFVSNFVLMGESGYFDNIAESKPLLHLWSLGIEEQFYIAWPIIIWLTWRLNFNIFLITLIAGVASFWLNIRGVKSDGASTFFSPQTRFWELLCGSLLAWMAKYNHQHLKNIKSRIGNLLTIAIYRSKPGDKDMAPENILSFIGFSLLSVGFITITKEAGFPGTWAAVPVLGAVLIIAAGSQAWINENILANKILVWLGLISFPLYLWHWPLLSFARIIASQNPSLSIRIAAVALSVILAWATYKFVERPLRFGENNKLKIFALLVALFVLGLAGYKIHERNGLPFRNVVKINNLSTSGHDGYDEGNAVPCRTNSNANIKLLGFCFEDRRGGVRFALIGDSKAGSLFPGLFRTSTDDNRWMALGVVKPIISSEPSQKVFSDQTLAALQMLSVNADVKTVVIANAIRAFFPISTGIVGNDYKTYNYKYLNQLLEPSKVNHAIYTSILSGLSETVARLTQSGKKVIFILDNPALPNSQDCIARKTDLSLINNIFNTENPDCIVSLALFDKQTLIYKKLLMDLVAKYPDFVYIFNPVEIYCDLELGICPSVRNNRIMYSYTDHISDYAGGLVGFKLSDYLSRFPTK